MNAYGLVYHSYVAPFLSCCSWDDKTGDTFPRTFEAAAVEAAKMNMRPMSPGKPKYSVAPLPFVGAFVNPEY